MNSALKVYDAGIAQSGADAQELTMRFSDGTVHTVPYDDWGQRPIPGDDSLVSRCVDPTLDIGCGPGRLVCALVRAGIPALGIDSSEESMRKTCGRGGLAMHRSVFSRIPGERRWSTVLLADGNIGIGGDPIKLLRRCADLICRDGHVIVEVLGPEQSSRSGAARMESGATHSEWFPWAHVSVTDLAAAAAAAGLEASDQWVSSRRWFTSLALVG